MIFDKKLIFRDHIYKKAALANRNLGLIFRSFVYIDKVMFLNLYKSLVHPHLEFRQRCTKKTVSHWKMYREGKHAWLTHCQVAPMRTG